MAKTTVPCPRCRTPIVVEITRLFDMNTDPQAKDKLLSGAANFISCPVCHYEGSYPTPIVYHDPEKELLLTFYPPELNVPVPEQEKVIGPLIKKVVDDLQPAKRKAYLFQPQTMLTQQHLFETILKADGITPEMMKAQQEKLRLIQDMAAASQDALPEIIKQNDGKIDEELFVLISRLAEASAAGGDQQGAQLLVGLQRALLEHSTYGRKLAEEAQETQAAIQSLQELSQKGGITRESLLDLLIKSADSDVRLTALVTLVRDGLDYSFFTLLSDRIEQATVEERPKLVALRDKLLKLIDEVDQTRKAQAAAAQALLDELLQAENIEQATQQALPQMDQAFVDVLNHAVDQAEKANDEEKLRKLAIIIAILQASSQSGRYIQLIETLLQAQDEAARHAIFEKAGDAVNADFLQILNQVTAQIEQSNNQHEMVEQLKEIYREALRYSMQRNLDQSASA